MKAIITVGISCSGKTTLANSLVKEGWVDINRDWIRFNVVSPGADWGTYKFTKKNENLVTKAQEEMFFSAVKSGKNIIISDTNLNPKFRDMWSKRLEESGYTVEIVPMHITLEEALKRDSLRANGVGASVIHSQWQRWLDFIGRKRYIPDTSKAQAVIVDIDGTLAVMKDRGAFDWDKVGNDYGRSFIIDMVIDFHRKYSIIIVSGRDSSCRKETKEWLYDHGVPFSRLYMREEGDMRKDSVVKEEIFWNNIADNFNVVAVIDDRPQMIRLWYDLGIENVISVANPYIEF